jgi:hypothetical protein
MNRARACVFKQLCLLVVAMSSFLQPLTAAAASSPVTQAWVARIEGPPSSAVEAGAMMVGPSGDVFVAGIISSPGQDGEILVSRHDTAGSLVWQQRFEPTFAGAAGGYVTAIAARGTNIYVAGSITTTNTGQDFLTLKYRDTGELEWAVRFDGGGRFTDIASAVAVDGLGNVVVAGDAISTNGSFDLTVVKYGPGGSLLWTYQYDSAGSNRDISAGLRLDDAGNIYIAGTAAEWTEQSAAVTLKLSPDGQELWVARETSGSVYGVAARGLDVDSVGNVVTVGTERFATVAWKYDASGSRQWLARYRAEEPASMQARQVRFDGGGNVLLAADLFGSGTNDAVVVKYAPDGRQLWASRIADPNNVAHVQGFDVDAAGNTYLCVTPNYGVVTVKIGADGVQLWRAAYDTPEFYDSGRFVDVDSSGNVFMAARSFPPFVTRVFVSLLKYTQQSVPGLPVATVTPALMQVDPGTNVVFTAGTAGAGPIQFQWRRNGRAMPNETNVTLAISNVQMVHRGDYSVVVSSPAGATISAEARLSVRTPPEVLIDPTNTVAYLGTETAFLATVAGNDFVVLQWRHNGTNIAGATNEILHLRNLTTTTGGTYDIVATTSGGSATSSAAGLRISSALELLRVTTQRSYYTGWNYEPRLQVLPNGDSIILMRTNNPAAGSTLLLRKLDATGALLWSASVVAVGLTNVEAAGLASDLAGNLFVIGVSGEPYINTAVITAKFSAGGQQLWFRSLAATNELGAGNASLAVDPNGNSTVGALGYYGTTVVRYSNTGDVIWSIYHPSGEDDTLAVAVDASGNSYIGTTIRVTIDSATHNEVRLRKIDPAGGAVWTRLIGDGQHHRLERIALDPSGNLIVAGTRYVEAEPGDRMFVIKYSPAGERLWLTRTGGDWPDLSNIPAMAIGAGGEITIVTTSDDDAEPEHSRVIRITTNGHAQFQVMDPQVIVNSPSQLALDGFGNAYITGSGFRPATGNDVVTAKYDSYGHRHWLAYHGVNSLTWRYGLALGVDAAGDIRVLATTDYFPDSDIELSLLHYRQRDPAGTFRLQLVRDTAGTFHLSTPTTEPFLIEASTDLQQWTPLSAGETQQLLQPGGAAFSGTPQRFFRLRSDE